MKIYLDYIFLENLVVNIFISYQVPLFCKFVPSKKKILIGSILLSFYSTLTSSIESGFIESLIVKAGIVLFSVYVLYKPENIRLYLKYFICYVMFNFIFLGIVIFLTLFLGIKLDNILVRLALYIISGLVLLFVNRTMWKMWKNNIKERIVYNVNVCGISFKAFVDTGNNVRDIYKGLDVLFVSEENREKLEGLESFEKTTLEISSATGTETMEGFILENVSISDGSLNITLNKIVVIFIDKELFKHKRYSALISYDTYIEKLKGATLC